MTWSDLESRAYAPYSKQSNACIILGKSGNHYPGVRVENVSFPVAISAVQAAVTFCLSEGDEPIKLMIKSEDQELEMLDFWVEEFGLQVVANEDIEAIEWFNPLNSFDGNEKALLSKLLENAVTPNSDFPVSCILVIGNDYISGVNIEVTSWNLGLCAERVALAKAYSSGFREIDSIAVHTLHGDYSSPCGACRQVISELLPFHPIRLHHKDGTRSEHVTVDLLPHHFSSTFLSGDKTK